MKYVKYINRKNLKVNTSYEGMSIEKQLVKVLQENTPIEAISPEIFTERKDGVRPEYDIRTDKWDIFHATTDKISQAKIRKITEANSEKNAENTKTETSSESS